MSRFKKQSAQSEYQWQLCPAWDGRRDLASRLNIPEFFAQILYNRSVTTPELGRSFLQPSLQDLIEPEQLTGIPAAIRRIREAITQNQKIVLYGDYDVDGIMGIAILWRCLQLAGVDVDYYVPHRIDEGYGLNEEAIRSLADRGTKLIITVDCGITAHAPAALAAELGIDLVITDHHQIKDQPAPAAAVVHPDLPGQDYPNKHLCGAGVAFKLAWALAQGFSGDKKVSPEFREFLITATSLAALGTIADVVPLLGENRLIAHFGLQSMMNCQDVGIRALIQAAGLQEKTLDSNHIGFYLAPRLNAAGRMGHARLAVELFTRSTAPRALQIAAYLEQQNQQRRKVEKEILEQSLDMIAKQKLARDDQRGFVLAGTDWHGGVIGIVASRIVDRFHRPTIILTHAAAAGILTGSGRSIPGFDLSQALTHCQNHLQTFGGHEMAAGLSLKETALPDFQKAFNDYACEKLSPQDLLGKLRIDAEVGFEDLDLPTVTKLDRLGPFGQGNPEIQLMMKNLQLYGQIRRMGSRAEHIQFTVTAHSQETPDLQNAPMLRVVGFGKGEWEKRFKDMKCFDLVFQPSVNHFNGQSTVQLLARDIRLADQ